MSEPPALPTTPPPEPLAPEPLAFDLRCTACGYNLRTQTEASRCPECGQYVADTLRDWQTPLALGAQTARFRRGTLYLAVSLAQTAFSGVCFMLFPLFTSGMTNQPWFGIICLAFYGHVFIEHVLWRMGIWAMTTHPTPGRQYWQRGAWVRPTARIFASLNFVTMLLEILLFTLITLMECFDLGPKMFRDSSSWGEYVLMAMLALVPVIFFCRFMASLFLVLWLGRLQQRKPLPGLRWILICSYILVPLVQVVWPFLGPTLMSILGAAAFRWLDNQFGTVMQYLYLPILIGPATLLAAGGCLFMLWLWFATRTKTNRTSQLANYAGAQE